MSANTRKRYNEEFKVEAVKLVTEKAYSLTQAAKSLGISIDSISKWKKRLEETSSASIAFPGNGNMNAIDKENRILEKEIKKLQIERDIKIIEKIKNIHKSSRMTYGYHRVHVELKENMEDINHKKVARLMRKNNIFSKRRVKFKVITKAAKTAVNIDNVLNRNFITNAPNKVWVSDITYIKTKQGFIYALL